MPVSCDNTPLSGNNGRVMFQPPGGTYCLLDNTDFPVGTRITVPASNDFRVGDAVVLRDEGGATLAQNAGNSEYNFNKTYYVVAGGKGNDWVSIATGAGGTAITVATEGGVAVTGALTGDGADPPTIPSAQITGGSGYKDGEYSNVPLTTLTGTGAGARADITVGSGAITAVTITSVGSGYATGNTLSAANGHLGNNDPAGSGFVITLTDAEVSNIRTDTPNAHVRIEHADYEVVCQVVEFSLDLTREEIDVTTLPCDCGDGTALANFRDTIPGTASGTGTMSVLFTPDQTSTANRLIEASMLKDQGGAKIKLYFNYVQDETSSECDADDENSMYIEAYVSLLGFSVTANTTDALTASITFSLRGQPTHLFYNSYY